MNKRFHLLSTLLFSLLGLCILFVACSEESDCSMTARPYLVCNFYKYGASKNIVRRDTLPSLTVKALETDSILLNRDTNVHTWDQPLRYTKKMTAFVLIYDENPEAPNALKDTIWVEHNNTSFFVSMECGFQMIQNITSIANYTQHKLDSVSLVNSEANYNGKENIKIIF